MKTLTVEEATAVDSVVRAAVAAAVEILPGLLGFDGPSKLEEAARSSVSIWVAVLVAQIQGRPVHVQAGPDVETTVTIHR